VCVCVLEKDGVKASMRVQRRDGNNTNKKQIMLNTTPDWTNGHFKFNFII